MPFECNLEHVSLFDLDKDDCISLFDNYYQELSYTESSVILPRLYDFRYFEAYNKDILGKFYYGDIEHLVRYIDLHFTDAMNDVIEFMYGKYDFTFEMIVKRYINRINISEIIDEIIEHDMENIVEFLDINGKTSVTLHEIKSKTCPCIFIYLFDKNPYPCISDKFLKKNIKTREFASYCKKVDFEKFCIIIKKLNSQCIKIVSEYINDTFRSAYCKLIIKNNDKSTNTISSVIQQLNLKTCTDTTRLIYTFM
jgi:hypothetical protein